MNYRVEIKFDEVFIDISNYIISEPTLNQCTEGEFEWSFWFDRYEVTLVDTIENNYTINKSLPVIIYYYGQKIMSGYIFDIIDETEEKETIQISIAGYDNVFCDTRIAYGLREHFSKRLQTISAIINDLKALVDNKLNNIGYYTQFFSNNVDCQDNVDFVDYQAFDLEEIDVPDVSLVPNLDKYIKGYWIESSDNPLKHTDLNWTDIHTLEQNGDILYGAFGATSKRVHADIYNIEDDMSSYLSGVINRGAEEAFDFKINDVIFIQYNDKYFRYIKTINKDYEDWKNYIEKLLVGGDAIDNEIKTLVVIDEIFYFEVDVTFRVYQPNNDDADEDGYIEKVETRYKKGTLIEQDLISCYYHKVKAGQILKDIMKVTNNIVYFSPSGKIYIKDRESGRGTFSIDENDILSKSIETKNIEFEDPSSISLPQGTGSNKGYYQPLDSSGNGIILMEGEPFDVVGQIKDYYNNIESNKENEVVKLTVITKQDYINSVLKVCKYGLVVDQTYNEETIEFVIKKRKDSDELPNSFD